MSSFYRATTPKHTYILPISTSELDVIQVTYSQGRRKVVKTYADGETSDGMTLDGYDVIINLTQEETNLFDDGLVVESQVRALTAGGKAYASQLFEVDVDRVLNDEVLS